MEALGSHGPDRGCTGSRWQDLKSRVLSIESFLPATQRVQGESKQSGGHRLSWLASSWAFCGDFGTPPPRQPSVNLEELGGMGDISRRLCSLLRCPPSFHSRRCGNHLSV